MPETTSDEHVIRAESICQSGSQWAALTWLELALFFYSNHLDASVNMHSSRTADSNVLLFLDFLHENFRTTVLRLILESEAPTAQALVDRFFASAVRLRRIDTLRKLIGVAGLDSRGTSVRLRKGIKDEDQSNDVMVAPVDFALRAGDTEMVDFLLDQGATFTVNASSGLSQARGGAAPDQDGHDVMEFGSSLDAAFGNLAIGGDTTAGSPTTNTSIPGSTGSSREVQESQLTRYLPREVFNAQRDRFSESDIIDSLRRITRSRPGVKSKSLPEMVFPMLDRLWEIEISGSGRLEEPLAVLVLAIRYRHGEMARRLVESNRIPDLDAAWSGFTAIAEATWAEDLELCDFLMTHGAHPEPVPPSELLSALQIAASMGNVSLAALLIEKGADVNYSFGGSHELLDPTPLHAAIARKHAPMVEFLLAKGAEISASNLVDLEPIISSRPGEYIGMMKRLVLAKGVGFARSALLEAVRRGDLALAKLLILAGAELEYESDRGETPLALALSLGYLSFVNYILETGLSRYDAAALLATTACSSLTPPASTIFDVLFQSRNRGTLWTDYLEGLCLATAVCLGYEATVEQLLNAGVRLNEHDPRGTRGMYLNRFMFGSHTVEVFGVGPGSRHDHVLAIPGATLVGTACFAMKPGVVQVLLRHGYQPNHLDLAIAARRMEQGIVELLLAAMPPMLSKGTNVDGILAILIRRGWISYVNSLLDKEGVGVNTAETYLPVEIRSLQLPLQAAVVAGDIKLVKRLLSTGADVNPPISTAHGLGGASSPPLRIAASSGNIGIARLLVERGADCNAPGVPLIGGTALEGAAEYGRIDMVQYLLSEGVNTTDGEHCRQYFRAIRLAEFEGHHLAARLLKEHREWSDQDHEVFASVHADDDFEFGEGGSNDEGQVSDPESHSQDDGPGEGDGYVGGWEEFIDWEAFSEPSFLVEYYV